MNRNQSVILFFAIFIFSSCNRMITFKFMKEAPDVVPHDIGFYNNVKSVFIRSNDQAVVSARELSSDINVLVNMMERHFQKNNFELKPDEKNADLVIEFIAVNKDCSYSTNTGFRKGKAVTYYCDFSFCGYRIYLKAINNAGKIVNYTFYQTPCANNGCTYQIGRNCDLQPLKGKGAQPPSNAPYANYAKQFPLEIETWGSKISSYIINEINNSKIK